MIVEAQAVPGRRLGMQFDDCDVVLDDQAVNVRNCAPFGNTLLSFAKVPAMKSAFDK